MFYNIGPRFAPHGATTLSITMLCIKLNVVAPSSAQTKIKKKFYHSLIRENNSASKQNPCCLAQATKVLKNFASYLSLNNFSLYFIYTLLRLTSKTKLTRCNKKEKELFVNFAMLVSS